MKFLLIALIVSSTSAFANPKTQAKDIKPTTTKAQPSEKAKAILKEEEDCDDKAKKEIKIEPETITLGGNTGCTIEE